jgi:hypothetical protein
MARLMVLARTPAKSSAVADYYPSEIILPQKLFTDFQPVCTIEMYHSLKLAFGSLNILQSQQLISSAWPISAMLICYH